MKKIFFAIFIFAFFSSVVFGQSIADSAMYRQKTSAFISFNAGAGIPTNNIYMENLIGGPDGGSYGTIGYNINISGGIPISHSHFGIIGFISYNAEPFNVNQCFLNLCDKSNTNQLVSSSYSDFKEILLMPGIFFFVPGKPTIDFRLLAGENFCTLAGYSLSGTSAQTYSYANLGPGGSTYTATSIDNITSSLQSASSSAMAFDFGIDVRLIQGAHFFGVLSSDFMWSQAYINTSYSESNQYYSIWNENPEHYRVNYNLLSFTVGLGYRF